MRAEDFLDAVGQIDDDLIDEALQPAAKAHRYKLTRLIPAAAAAVLVIAGTIFLTHISGGGGTATIVGQQAVDGVVSGTEEEKVSENKLGLNMADAESTEEVLSAEIGFEAYADEEGVLCISVKVTSDSEKIDPGTLSITADIDESYGTLEFLEEYGTDGETCVAYIFRGTLPESGMTMGTVHITGTDADGEEISQDLDIVYDGVMQADDP